MKWQLSHDLCFHVKVTLLVPKDKISFMNAIEKAVPFSSTNATLDFAQDVQDAELDPDNNELNIVDVELFGGDVDSNVSCLSNIDLEESENSVIIFDGMAVVQSMEKNSTMKKILNLAEQFIKRIRRLMKGYTEGRVLFAQYLEHSLKKQYAEEEGSNKGYNIPNS